MMPPAALKRGGEESGKESDDGKPPAKKIRSD